MREILTALIDDTSRQIPLMELAIREGDSQKCARLAHYSKGACANVGAAAAAEVLKTMEHRAANHEFQECGESLSALVQALNLLRSEAQSITL
jgi:HPt (histidine-containing phosphotransfer) domain-containing protein